MANITVLLKDINPATLSADDLISLRKPPDMPTPESFREKGYIPTEADRSHVTSLLEDQKKMLDQKSVARIADLIQAEWNCDSKRAIAIKLKGKTQHMGISVDRKVSLSPEETIFLLENGNLELRLNDVPLSTESAYAKVLTEDLALEKYQVYSHLSRLGYVVVQHQKDVDLVQKEKLHAQGKCHCKKKRKLLETNMSSKKKICPSNGISVEQRTISPCELFSDTSLRVSPSHSNAENSSSNLIQKEISKTFKTTIDVCEETPILVNSSGDKSVEQVPCTSSSVATDDNDIPVAENVSRSIVADVSSTNDEKIDVGSAHQKSPNMSGTTQLIPSSNVITEHLKENASRPASPYILKDKAPESTNSNDDVIESEHDVKVSNNHSDKEVEDDRSSNNVVDVTITSENSAESSKEIPDAQEVIIECSENKGVSNLDESSKYSHADEITITDDEKSCTKNGTDAIASNEDSNQREVAGDSVENKHDDCVENVKEPRINVFRIDDETSSDDSDSSSDSDILYVNELNDGESAQLCEEANEDSVQSVSVDEAVEVDDVLVLQVNRKQVEPLDVINLSSDEDNQSEKDASDDEVLILEDCSTVKPACKKQGWLLASSKLKREGGGKALLKMERNGRSDDDWSFPIIFRKRVICLPRPPALLLPFNAGFNNEAYTVDTNNLTGPNNYFPPTKLWNSYKDLQQRMYSFKNEAGLNCDYPRGFLPNSSQQRANFNPFSSRSSPNPVAFQNNLLPQTNSRLSLLPEERNFSPHMAQASSFSLNPMLRATPTNGQFPMGGLIPNQPRMNDNGSPFLLGSPRLHSSPQQDPFNMTEDSKQNVHYQGSSPWMNAGRREENFPSSNSWRSPTPNDEGFRSSQSIWMNRPHNEDSVRSFSDPWMNAPRNEGFGSSPNLRMNTPCNEGSFRPSADPWMNPPGSESFTSSPSPFDFVRNQSNFRNQVPFQEPGRNFPDPWTQGPGGMLSNPWIQNWQSPWFQNDTSLENRHPGNYQQNPMQSRSFLENPYPCEIPKFSKHVSSWNDIKSSTHMDTDKNQDDDEDDVEEVPIDIDEVLWSKEIRPLVKPGPNLSLNDVLKTLQITTSANLSATTGFNERCLPEECNIQISFDVYMPGTIHRKSCPTVPNHRIIVTRSSDPFPKFSDIVVLLRKLKDGAFLQYAVVDNGSIMFYSFNNVNLPLLVPHQ